MAATPKPVKIDILTDMKRLLHVAGLSLQDDLSNTTIHPAFRDDIILPSPPDLFDEDSEVKSGSDEGNICCFCEGPFPMDPSPELKKLGLLLKARPEFCKQAGRNHLGSYLPFNLTADYCQMHRAETHIIPNGIACGWPSKIDFSSLHW
ncbi:uncharacterized protein VP01_1564g3 [Puccinia sorghi]|uniref:Uncharacterized protein n=1 Tax=Puccinia sorghi TaxID=27349 RepID=A0A0L6VHX8_9BASI|nr:uncharacterized protein VP01_1564g3 [Puccinia sorghi]